MPQDSAAPAHERGPARAARRLQQLIDATLAFAAAETIEELVSDVVERAVVVLGADAGMVAVRDGEHLGVNVSHSLSHLPDWGQPLDSNLPMAQVTRTGRRVLLPTRASRRAFSALADERYSATGREAWAFFPLRSGTRVLGSLAVGWREERWFSDDELALLEAFAAQCGPALERIRLHFDERAAAHQVARLAEALQVSLLSRPPTPHGIEIAARYQPAAEQAKVGGDFYDAFIDSTGALVVAVGDVGGHDTAAAAAMAQIRNLLRGLAYDTKDEPATILRRLDQAIEGLQVDVMATALLARVEPDVGQRRLVWTSAGHLPPMVRHPDGTVTILEEQSNIMLGVRPDVTRTQHSRELPNGATLLLYTDGLIERRDCDIDASITGLAALFAKYGHQAPEQLCDTLLRHDLATGEDDVALLVLRTASG